MKKVLNIIILITLLLLIPANSVKASNGSIVESYINNISADISEATTGGTASSTTTIIEIVNRVLGFLQITTAILVVIIIASTGFRYIVETPEVKGDIKKTMTPVIIGIIFVFFATSIAKFFVGIFSSSN